MPIRKESINNKWRGRGAFGQPRDRREAQWPGSVLLIQNKREDGCVGVFCLCFAALIAGVNGHRTIITVVRSTSASGLWGMASPAVLSTIYIYIARTGVIF